MNKFIVLLVLVFSFSRLVAQEQSDETGGQDVSNGGSVTYIGDDARIGIGIDDEGDWLGDFLFLLSEDHDSAWLGEGWVGKHGAGGLKLDYHWVPGGLDPEQPASVPENTSVEKLFLAVDQNMFDDRKATLGWGMEKEAWFMNIQGSVGLTDERLVDQNTLLSTITETGTIDGRPYTQDFTTTTITRFYEQAFDYGVGGRLGTWFDNSLVRLTAGLDYEWGDYSSDQLTFSLGLEKYFNGSPHSFAIEGEYFDRDGDFERRDSSDVRAYLLYRYDFGETHRPTRATERVRVEPEQLTVAQGQRKLVQHDISMTNDVWFELDKYELRAEAMDTLQQVANLVNNSGIVGVMEVVGNTCDLASDEYNHRLSERRANAVRNGLVALGIDDSLIHTRGDGESNPRYPNDSEENRSKNRRVDIRFVTRQDTWEEVPVDIPPEAHWEVREIPREPAWLRRALRNPAKHKRRVDTYQFQTEQSETVPGEINFINRPPSAVDDSLTVEENSGATVIDVLNNDSDPDGDALTVTAVTQPANGTVENHGVNVDYTPDEEFFGVDTFSYTISDGNGGTATATVTVTVTEFVPPNQAPVANNDFATTSKDTAVVIDVLANDFDPDGDPISVIEVVNTTMGTSIINPDGTITYHPMPGWWGGDTFEYTISDPHGATATATVVLEVTQNP